MAGHVVAVVEDRQGGAGRQGPRGEPNGGRDQGIASALRFIESEPISEPKMSMRVSPLESSSMSPTANLARPFGRANLAGPASPGSMASPRGRGAVPVPSKPARSILEHLP